MARYGAQQSGLESIERVLPNLIILVVLVLALLVVVTKFGWVHCSQVPGINWCGTYCTYVVQGKSRIGILYGQDGLGDPQALRAQLSRKRGFTLVEPIEAKELSAGILRKYDLLVVEHFKTASTRQVDAISGYLDSGGTMVWSGDSLSNQFIDDYDLQLARTKNETFYRELLSYNVTPNSAQWTGAWNQVKSSLWYQYLYNHTTVSGFGALEDYLHARFGSIVNSTSTEFRIVDPDHLLVRGLIKQHGLLSTSFVQVLPDASKTSIVAQVVTPGNNSAVYPGVIETRYAGKIVYVAFPLEQSNSSTFLTNLIDYLAPC